MVLTPSAKEVDKCIKSLDSKKSSDIYGMSTKFLKEICRPVSDILRNLFNESFSQGIFPDHMKLALVAPVYKGKSKLEVCNYRPISILSIFRKVLEKLMLNRLTGFPKKSKIIYEHQFGFQTNKSTTFAVLDIYTEIVNSLDKVDLACSAILDFAKAFDTVDHKILISKLENYGLRGTCIAVV